MIHRFGAFEVDAQRFELRRGGRVVPVQPRVLETILFFASSGGKLITRADLMAGPWQGTFVSDAAFKQAIMHARRALADPEQPHAFIVTVHGKGFRWVNPEPDAIDRHAAPGAVQGPLSQQQGVALARLRGEQPAPGLAAKRAALAGIVSMLTHLRGYGDQLAACELMLLSAHRLLELGERREFRRVVAQHARLARQLAYPAHDWYGALLASVLMYHDGRLMQAQTLLSDVRARGKRCLGPSADAIIASHSLNLAFELTGSAKRKVLRAVERLALTADAEGSPPLENQLLAAVAMLHLGETEKARHCFRTLTIDIAALPDNRHLLPMLVNLTDLAITFGDGQRLRLVYERLEPHVGLTVARDFSDWGPVSYHMARVMRASGDGASARVLLQRARVESKSAGSRCWYLWAGHGLSRVLHESSSRRDRQRGLRLRKTLRLVTQELELPALNQALSR